MPASVLRGNTQGCTDEDMSNNKKSIKRTTDPDTFMNELDHPHKAGINRLRAAIKGTDPRIVEEVKWNAPSYRLEEHFATFKLYPPKQIQLVLHRGTKPKPVDQPFQLPDPHGLTKWRAPDRCVITMTSSEHAVEVIPEVISMVRLWIAQL